jgi:hypothetical protein
LDRHTELHPLVVGVERLPPAPGALRSYAITDRLRIGPVGFRVRYRADVLAATEREVHTVAHQRPGTTVHNRSRISPDGDRTGIEVEITLRAPAPLFGYALRQARRAHERLAARLPGALEDAAAQR